jgi:uncharacterized membrane protein YcjF (UPF0283 family)
VPNPLDINDVFKGQAISVKLESETPEAAAARLQEEAAEARHRRRIQFWTVMVTILLVLFAVFVCGDVILTGAAEDKKSAWPILGAILNTFVSGLIGFAIGKKS